jgi:hypothetical protein
MLDCIYKTNKFNMPLLNICTMTGSNKVVQVGLCFLASEKEGDYDWAMRILRKIMREYSIKQPLTVVTDRELALINSLSIHFDGSHYILYRWHININVLAKTKGFFPKPVKQGTFYQRHPTFKAFLANWNTILTSTSEEEYKTKLDAFKRKYPTNTTKYYVETWLDLWKEHIVRFWVDKHLYFGILVTSPIEGCHVTIKAYLKRSTSNLKGVFDRLRLFWVNQQYNLLDAKAREMNKPRYNTSTPLFVVIQSKVYNYTLQKIIMEAQKIKANTPSREDCQECPIQ